MIPAYNCGDEIAGAVDSAFGQTGVEAEVVVVNDGSTDTQTEPALDQLQQKYGDRLVVLHQPNQGPAAARNTALQRCNSQWIAFLDHDDRWAPEKLLQQLKAAAKQQADVVLTAAENFDCTERVDQYRPVPILEDSADVFTQLLLDNFVTLSSALVRRECLERAGRFNTDWKGVEDWALWLQLAADGCRFAAVSQPLVRYRWHDSSLSHNHDAMQQQRRDLVRQTLKTAAGCCLPKRLQREILTRERLCSAWFTADARPRRAARLYLQALRHSPLNRAAWKGLLKSLLGRN